MYISNFWIVISVIWIIYLLWRIWRLKSAVSAVANFYDNGVAKKQNQIRDLCGLIREINRKTLSKAPAKEKEKVLKEESKEILNIFEKNHADGVSLSGKYTDFEPEALTQVGAIFDVIFVDDESRSAQMDELYESLKIDTQ